ncbi:hypothetical protein [Nocardia sp. alder85J]|uniref:hypothetical protein n=1 Tax=Nocardia sp. alder85J TaxID=2862949 RepID=UPI001CD3CDFD|nr:hypothetical protein [Nocardia sp. alder85J]MCX4094160.1 hypothetical protein [Nocardia sp. alder85J]
MRDRVLDRLLRSAIERAGAPNGLWFTERQLYYQFCRAALPAHRLPHRVALTVPVPVGYAVFRRVLRRHGEVPGLLALRPPRTGPAGRHTAEPDLFDYGLPRLLVCQSESVAQMLRANALPMESACPVLSAAELPLDPRVAAMLGRVERSAVYVLHDASAEGHDFPARVAELAGIPDTVRVVPLGLRANQAARLHVFHQRGVVRPVVAAAVDPWERAWLDRGRFAEVEAVRPASLLRTVHRLVRDIRRPPRTLAGEWRRARAAGFLTWPAA